MISILASCRRSNRRAASAGIEQPDGPIGMGRDDARNGGNGDPAASAGAGVDAGVEELNEMTIGRTDDPVNPTLAMALEAASLFGIGSRNPSGPAAMQPRQQAGHMTAIEPPVRFSHLCSCIQGAVHTCEARSKRGAARAIRPASGHAAVNADNSLPLQ